MTIRPMFRSNRIQITIGDRAYKDLENLAELAELEIHTEARLLLTWGIELAKRRWRALSEDEDPPTGNAAFTPGWQQPALPMIDVTPAELSAAMDELAARRRDQGDTGPTSVYVEVPIDPA